MKRIIAMVLTPILLFFFSHPTEPVTLSSARTDARCYLQEAERSPGYGKEWAVFALARSVPTNIEAQGKAWLRAYRKKCAETGGALNTSVYTDYARVALTLSALGLEPEENLWQKLTESERVARQGATGIAFALLALQNMPQTAEISAAREAYIQSLLSGILPDGGWTLSGETADTDVTAIVLCALAKERENPAVSQTIEVGLQTLSDLQHENATFAGYGIENAESIAQVLITLSALGISPEDERFCKNGQTAADALLQFRNADGGFAHTVGGASQLMPTVQVLNALESINRLQNHESALYDCSDVQKPLIDNRISWTTVFTIADIAAAATVAAILLIRWKKRKKQASENATNG